MTAVIEKESRGIRMYDRLSTKMENTFITPAKMMYNIVVYILNILYPTMLVSCSLEKIKPR